MSNYLHYDGIVDGVPADQLNEIKEKIEVLEKYQMLYRIGRSRRIDRSVLEDSGAISDVHMENVMALLGKVDGQPDLMIEELERGEVPRFRTNKIEELLEYCISQNFIDPSEKLSDEKIRTRLQALLSHMTLSGSEAENFLRRIIDHQVINEEKSD